MAIVGLAIIVTCVDKHAASTHPVLGLLISGFLVQVRARETATETEAGKERERERERERDRKSPKTKQLTPKSTQHQQHVVLAVIRPHVADIDDEGVELESKIWRIIWAAWHKGIGYGMIIAAWVNVYLGFAKLKRDYFITGVGASVIDALQIVPAALWLSVFVLECVVWRASTASDGSEVAGQEDASLARSKSGVSDPNRGRFRVKRETT